MEVAKFGRRSPVRRIPYKSCNDSKTNDREEIRENKTTAWNSLVRDLYAGRGFAWITHTTEYSPVYLPYRWKPIPAVLFSAIVSIWQQLRWKKDALRKIKRKIKRTTACNIRRQIEGTGRRGFRGIDASSAVGPILIASLDRWSTDLEVKLARD